MCSKLLKVPPKVVEQMFLWGDQSGGDGSCYGLACSGKDLPFFQPNKRRAASYTNISKLIEG